MATRRSHPLTYGLRDPESLLANDLRKLKAVNDLTQAARSVKSAMFLRKSGQLHMPGHTYRQGSGLIQTHVS